MTRLGLFTEICNRCGEGFENWIERAKAHFKASVIELLAQGGFVQNEYPIMLLEGSYVFEADNTIINLSDIIDSQYSIIEFNKVKHTTLDGVESKVHVLNFSDYQAYEYNTTLLPSGDIAAYYRSDGALVFANISMETSDVIDYVLTVWTDEWLNTTLEADADTVIDAYWSPIFLELAIQSASAKLKAEIKI